LFSNPEYLYWLWEHYAVQIQVLQSIFEAGYGDRSIGNRDSTAVCHINTTGGCGLLQGIVELDGMTLDICKNPGEGVKKAVRRWIVGP